MQIGLFQDRSTKLQIFDIWIHVKSLYTFNTSGAMRSCQDLQFLWHCMVYVLSKDFQKILYCMCGMMILQTNLPLSSCLQFVSLCFLKSKLTSHTWPEELELHLASLCVYRVQEVDYMFSIAIFQSSSLLYQLLYTGRCTTVPIAQTQSRYNIIT